MNLSDLSPNTRELYVEEDFVRAVLHPEDAVSNQIHEVIKSRIRELEEQFDKASNIEHSLTKGEIREEIIIDFFEEIVPPKHSVEGGFICDITGQNTPQLDFIIANTSEIPPVVLGSYTSLVPPESAISTLEVKSRLSHSDKDQIQKQAESINSLKIPSHVKELGIKYDDESRFAIPIYIFALETDISYGEANKWLKEIPNLVGICIFKEFYKQKKNKRFEEPEAGKVETYDGKDFSETLIFIFSMLRRAAQISSMRKFLPILPTYIRGIPKYVDLDKSLEELDPNVEPYDFHFSEDNLSNLTKNRFSSLSVSNREEAIKELKYQSFMTSHEILFSTTEEFDRNRALDRAEYRLDKMGISREIPESVREDPESDELMPFLSKIGDQININLSETIARCFAIPINSVVIARDQMNSDEVLSDFSILKEDSKSANLPQGIIAALQELEDKLDSIIEPGAAHFSLSQNPPILQWLDNVRKYLSRNRESINPLNSPS